MIELVAREYNMDSGCVELHLSDDTLIAIHCTEVENEVADNMYQRSELDWLIYNDPLAYVELILSGEVERDLRDVTEYKTTYIRENCDRMQLSDKVQVQVWDATVKDEALKEAADVVLMDVPCSGLGVLGKKRDIKYNVSPESMESLNELQKSIVDHSWEYVKKGGTLLYSTCTIHRKENEDMCRWICENYPFELEEERQILPGLTQADGFYYARLHRKE